MQSMAETALGIRSKARCLVSDSVVDAATKSHERNYETLYIRRDGSIHWFEGHNRSDGMIDRDADRFSELPSVIQVGTGSCDCNCDYCADASYQTKVDAIAGSVSDSDLSDMESGMLDSFDRIRFGYFDDESEY